MKDEHIAMRQAQSDAECGLLQLIHDELRGIRSELSAVKAAVGLTEWTPISQAARITGISVRTLKRRIKSGELRGQRLDGRWSVNSNDLNSLYHV